MRKPWFRKHDGWWYVTVLSPAGKRESRRLSRDKDEALKLWHAAQAGVKRTASVTLLEVTEARCGWAKHNLSQKTLEGLIESVGPFVAAYGDLAYTELKLHHASRWIADKKMPKGAERAFVINLKAMFNWAMAQGLVAQNPFRHLPRPRQGRREATVSEAQQQAILEATDGAFRCVVIALMHTGCRPQAIRVVTAQHFLPDMECWVFPARQHKTGHETGDPLVVYLGPCVTTLCRILAASRRTGALFRNSYGTPWTDDAIVQRMRRLRKKLGLPDGTVAYSYRHSFTTNCLLNGVDVASAAALLGHRNTEQIRKHYGHLDKHSDHLRAAVRRANSHAYGQSPEGQPPGPSPAS